MHCDSLMARILPATCPLRPGRSRGARARTACTAALRLVDIAFVLLKLTTRLLKFTSSITYHEVALQDDELAQQLVHGTQVEAAALGAGRPYRRLARLFGRARLPRRHPPRGAAAAVALAPLGVAACNVT